MLTLVSAFIWVFLVIAIALLIKWGIKKVFR